jgi:signal transduction histidine kinase
MVHEVNNPLDGVIRYVNLAFDSIEEDSPAKDYLVEARRGLSRIVKVIRSLLDFSWSLSGQKSRIDVNHTIEESLFSLNYCIVSHNIKVNKILAPNPPKLADYRLKLAFNNIIKNACEAMNQGGTLTIFTAMRNGDIEIQFKDTGCGIDQELQGKIFEPFFTTKDIGEGSGLGLAICHDIIDRYKGTINVESKPNEGTTFIIRLPVKINH